MNAVRLLVAALCAMLLAVTMVLWGVAISLSVTLLNGDWVAGELGYFPVQTLFADEAKTLVPPEASFLFPVIDKAAEDLEPWARQQTAVVVHAFETYVKGRQPFSATISFEEPKQYLSTHLGSVLLDSGLPGMEHLNPEQLQAFVDQLMVQVDSMIPDTFQLTESYFDAGTLEGIRAAREYAGYLSMGLWLLPIIAILLALSIAWVRAWRGRPVTRLIGAALLVAGIVSLILRVVVPPALTAAISADLPAEMSSAVSTFIYGCSGPLNVYGVAVAVVGVLLIVLSFRFRPVEV